MLRFDQFEILNAIPVSFTEDQRNVLAFREPADICEWMEDHFVIVKGPMPGPFRFSNSPYLYDPFKAFGGSKYKTIVLQFPPQVGKTVFGMGCIAYLADQKPGPVMLILQDAPTAKEIIKKRIIPIFKKIEVIRSKFTRFEADASSLAIYLKNGFELHAAWASSTNTLSSKTVRDTFGDEVGKWPEMTGKELSPDDMADVRRRTYGDEAKSVLYSSPNIEGDILDKQYSGCDVNNRWGFTCPHCGHEQIPEFGDPTTSWGIKWPGKIKSYKTLKKSGDAFYACRNCLFELDEYVFKKACNSGLYIQEFKVDEDKADSVAFNIESWATPYETLSSAAAAWLKGETTGKKLDKKFFVTQHEAKSFVEVVEQAKEEDLKQIIVDTLEPQTVPEEAVVLTAGVDVQLRGFYIVVRAWARDYTSWLIHYDQISTWKELEELLFEKRYPHRKSGLHLPISRATIDTGGGRGENLSVTMTEETYWWVRKNCMRGPRVWATKGSSKPLAGMIHIGKPLDKTPSNKPIPGGLQLIKLDTEQIKDAFFYKIRQAKNRESEAGYLHRETKRDYFKQIMAERKQLTKNGEYKYIRIHRDNHYLDCECGALVCAYPEWPGGGAHLFQPLVPQIHTSDKKKKRKTSEREDRW